MKKLALILCFSLQGCALFRPAARPAHAPPGVAAQVQFPRDLPREGLHEVKGPLAAAIALAMEDFRPLGTKPHDNATPLEQCLYRREAFDVEASPGPNGVVFVRFSFSPSNCPEPERGIALDMGATYAVEVAGKRIIAVER
jgi:hypothetical protein